MRTLNSFYKGPGCLRWGGTSLLVDDTTKGVSQVLGEESVRGLKDESEAILHFAT